MLVIGIAGGVASGKSLVARYFQEMGAEVLDADRVGHLVLTQQDVKQSIREIWGDEVFSNGEVNRAALAQRVFGPDQSHRDQLKQLEAITHPKIAIRLEQELGELRGRGDHEAVVLDAPVMFKAGWDRLCDEIVFVDVDVSTRVERTRNRGWSADELRKREEQQFPLAEKKKRATVFVDNSGTKIETWKQVVNIWANWGLSQPSEVKPPTH